MSCTPLAVPGGAVLAAMADGVHGRPLKTSNIIHRQNLVQSRRLRRKPLSRESVAMGDHSQICRKTFWYANVCRRKPFTGTDRERLQHDFARRFAKGLTLKATAKRRVTAVQEGLTTWRRPWRQM